MEAISATALDTAARKDSVYNGTISGDRGARAYIIDVGHNDEAAEVSGSPRQNIRPQRLACAAVGALAVDHGAKQHNDISDDGKFMCLAGLL